MAQQPLSIQDAVESAIQHNDHIAQYQHRVEERSYEDKGATGSFFPSLTLSAGYNVLNAPLTIDLNPIRDVILKTQAADQVNFASAASQMKGGPAITDPSSAAYQAYYGGAYKALDAAVPSFTDTLKKQQYPSAEITLVQPLFAGGRLMASKKAAHAETQSADFELTKTKNEVAQDATIKYLSIALLQNVVTVRRQVLEAMERHRKNADKLAQQGVVAKYQLLRADVAVAEAQRALFDDSTRLSLAALALHTTMNDGRTGDITALDTMVYRPLADSVESFIDMAAKQQPLFKMIDRKRAMAHQKTIAQRGAFLPQVAAFGKLELFPKYLSDLEPPWIVGVTASLDLFSGAKTLTSLKAARSQEKEIDAIENGAHHDVSLWINKSYRDLRNAEQRYHKLSADCDLAEENVRQCKSRFEAGYGTSLEVIDANCVVERNRIECLVSLFDYYKAMTDLFTAAGEPETVVAFISRKGA
jgi:outer membrane protein TolC